MPAGEVPIPPTSDLPIEGVDARERAELADRGRPAGHVHAEGVALVLRDVELTGDVLAAATEALEHEGISIDDAVEGYDDDDTPPSGSDMVIMPQARPIDDAADERLLSRRRRSRASRA